MIGAALVRPALYGACALLGVQATNRARPVTLDQANIASNLVGAGRSVVDQLRGGDIGGAFGALVGGSKETGLDVARSVDSQIRNNIIIGITVGVAIAAVLDAVVLA